MQKKIPTRKCVGCGQMKEKKDLIRVIKTPEDEILLDTTGKANGRGAYICKSIACLKKARRAMRIEHSLECKIPEEIYESIEAQLINE